MWERQVRGKWLAVRVQPFGALGRGQQRALEVEAERIGEVLGVEASLEIGRVTVRPHL